MPEPIPFPAELSKSEVLETFFSDVDRYIPLVLVPLEDPPPGQVRLFRTVRVPDDPEGVAWLEQELARRRDVLLEALFAGDWRVRFAQQGQFAFYVCKLVWQRFRLEPFVTLPTCRVWHERFAREGVFDDASAVYEKYGDVLLAVDPSGIFDLCSPDSRGARFRNRFVTSLEPVFEVLALRGLWCLKDEGLSDLARSVIALAKREQERLGVVEFRQRYGGA